jgi:hypothetical protein
MDAAKEQLLKIDLSYELDMFEGAYARLASNAPDAPKPGFERNAVIESFWTHARNLNEFILQPPNSGVTASARDFTVESAPFGAKLNKTLTDRINQQISHLHYGRPKEPDEKLAHDIHRFYTTINSAIKEFEKRLTPEAANIWKVRNPPPTIAPDGQCVSDQLHRRYLNDNGNTSH